MSKPTDTWMPLYIGDYLADTQHLSFGEHGVYLLLIMAYWRNGGPLPDDDRTLRRIAKCDPRQWTKMRLSMSSFFETCCKQQNGEKVWRHKRIDAELENAEKLTNARQKGGRITAAKRWGAGSSATVELIAKPIASRAPVLPSPSPSPSLPTGSKEPERESRAREAPDEGSLSQGDEFAVSEEMIRAAAEVRARHNLPPVNLHLEAEKFRLYPNAIRDGPAWLRWALMANPELSPKPNGHDPSFVYVPDRPPGPPPPLSQEEIEQLT